VVLTTRSAEEVDVIGHDHKRSDLPAMERGCFFPFLPKDIEDFLSRQKGATMGRAGRDEIDLGGRPDPIKPTKVTMKGHGWRIGKKRQKARAGRCSRGR